MTTQKRVRHLGDAAAVGLGADGTRERGTGTAHSTRVRSSRTRACSFRGCPFLTNGSCFGRPKSYRSIFEMSTRAPAYFHRDPPVAAVSPRRSWAQVIRSKLWRSPVQAHPERERRRTQSESLPQAHLGPQLHSVGLTPHGFGMGGYSGAAHHSPPNRPQPRAPRRIFSFRRSPETSSTSNRHNNRISTSTPNGRVPQAPSTPPARWQPPSEQQRAARWFQDASLLSSGRVSQAVDGFETGRLSLSGQSMQESSDEGDSASEASFDSVAVSDPPTCNNWCGQTRQRPESHLCPITHDVIDLPAMLNCGHTFDLEPVRIWFTKSLTCPMCRAPAHPDEMRPNYNLKIAMDAWVAESKVAAK